MDRWSRVKQILQSALDRPPEERSAFVRDACDDDRNLHAEVESLLVAHDAAGQFATPTSASGDSSDLIGREIDAYRVVSLLGAGGVGKVYRATPNFIAMWRSRCWNLANHDKRRQQAHLGSQRARVVLPISEYHDGRPRRDGFHVHP
jgi:hypothetical protein